MADNSVLVFKCLNPECGKTIKLKRPQKSGIYPVTCPYCKVKKNLNIKGLDAFAQGNSEVNTEKPNQIDSLDNSAKPVASMADDFIVGEVYKFMCPHCGKQELGISSQKAGKKEFACPLCKGKISVNIREKTNVLKFDEPGSSVKGKLVLLRRGWLNKDYHLNIGPNIIGRYDEIEMSDIGIKNDSGISRRSVRIDVVPSDAGFMFKLTVLKATNPVLHNNSRLSIGDAVSLNFGDIIVLGKTRLRFDKDI